MISGLLKLMHRLSLARCQTEFTLSLEIDSSIDSGLASTEVRYDRSPSTHLELCTGYRGAENVPVAAAYQIVQ
jgi:hypothetical protein